MPLLQLSQGLLVLVVVENILRHFHSAHEDDDESDDKKSGDHLLGLRHDAIDNEHDSKNLEPCECHTNQIGQNEPDQKSLK